MNRFPQWLTAEIFIKKAAEESSKLKFIENPENPGEIILNTSWAEDLFEVTPPEDKTEMIFLLGEVEIRTNTWMSQIDVGKLLKPDMLINDHTLATITSYLIDRDRHNIQCGKLSFKQYVWGDLC